MTSREYIFPAGMDVEDLLARVRQEFTHHSEATRTLQRTLYDSFDWRLHAAGSLLADTREGDEHTLELRALSGKRGDIRQKSRKPPKFARDLPPGRIRDLIEPVLEMRELTPKIGLRARLNTLRILNKDEKTVAYLQSEEYTLLPRKGGRSMKPGARAIIIPVKGYPKPFSQLAGFLEREGLTAAQDDLMLDALSRLGITPGGYSTKLDLTLDPAMRADQACKAILNRLLEIMLQNEDGTRTGTDTEFLHDFRVAIRRTRSALTQIKKVFPQRIVDRYKTEFAWLGQVTTPSRDLDVYLLNFDEYRDSLPASMQADIEPLRKFLIRHQKTEHRALVKALNSARYRRLINSWRRFLDEPVNERTTVKNASRPVLEVACKRIWSIYRLILREGNAIQPDSPATDLHELRKTGKKLRYLIEFFQSLYPEDRIRELIRTLKLLQDNLGNFQDYEVQVITLKRFSHQMVAEGGVSPDTLLAMGMLIDGLNRRQHQAREEFAGRFAEFSLPLNQDRFRELFAPSTSSPST